MSRITLGNAERFMKSVWNWIKSGGKIVESRQSEKRAKICAECPLNDAKHRKGKCPSCLKGMVYVFMRKNLWTSWDEKLTYCQVCGCDLRVKVHIPMGVIDNEGLEGKYPAHCWQNE